MHVPAGTIAPLAALRASACGGPESVLSERAASARLGRASRNEIDRWRRGSISGWRTQPKRAAWSGFWRRGIPASLFERTGSWAVEVQSAPEEQQRLLGDVAAALEPWLVATGRAGLALHLGECHYTLRPGLGCESRPGGKEPT